MDIVSCGLQHYIELQKNERYHSCHLGYEAFHQCHISTLNTETIVMSCTGLDCVMIVIKGHREIPMPNSQIKCVRRRIPIPKVRSRRGAYYSTHNRCGLQILGV